jgi:hypothetical protein
MSADIHRYLAHRVSVKRVQVGSRTFDQIKVVIGDLHLKTDLMSDRDIRLAHRLAEDHQATFLYDEANAERVRRVLGIQHDANT